MPAVKIADLSPTPFFARFLEGQFSELTPEQMKRVHGGAAPAVTMAYPSDSDAAEVTPPPFPAIDLTQWPWPVINMPGMPSLPTSPVCGPRPVDPGPRPVDPGRGDGL